MAKRRLTRDDLEIIEGDRIKVSKGKGAMVAASGVLLLVCGLATCLAGGGGILAGAGVIKDKKGTEPVRLYTIGGLGLAIGLCFVPIACVICYKGADAIFGGESMILGDEAVQWLRGSKILTHLPYDNIADVREDTKEVPSADGRRTFVVHFIGINLIDLRRRDTLLDRAAFKRSRKNNGYDIVIEDRFELALGTIRQTLVKRWAAEKKW